MNKDLGKIYPETLRVDNQGHQNDMHYYIIIWLDNCKLHIVLFFIIKESTKEVL